MPKESYDYAIAEVKTTPTGVISIHGTVKAPDGTSRKFIASDNVDPSYPDRFKVNWNGSKARMPVAVGQGLRSEVIEAVGNADDGMYFGRGARISIARMAKNLVKELGLTQTVVKAPKPIVTPAAVAATVAPTVQNGVAPTEKGKGKRSTPVPA